MAIPPISSPLYPEPSPSGGVEGQLWKFVEEYRTLMHDWTADPTSHQNRMQGFLKETKEYLDLHRQEIFARGKREGWPQQGTNGYGTHFTDAKTAIDNFMQTPTPDCLDKVHSELTQLHWLLTHHQL